jgi:CHAT domain-containing protein
VVYSSQDTLQVFPILGIDYFRRRVDAWRAVLLPPERLSDTDAYIEKERFYAKDMYDKLLFNVEKAGMLRSGRHKRIIFLPDGPLWNVPFAALLHNPMPNQEKRLIEEFPISLASSLNSLTQPTQKTQPKYPLFYVADPLGTSNKKLLLNNAKGNKILDTFGPVPYFGANIPPLGKKTPRSIGLVHKNATLTKVVEFLPNSSVFLFGGHGDIAKTELSTDSGLLSALILAGEGKNAEKEARLTGYDIMKLPLKMQLAILLACHTGEGRSAGGEGLFGLVWAFQVAGCQSVLAAQWRAVDKPSFALFEVFWQELRRGKRKDDALRTAIHTVRSRTEWSSPYFWSVFQLYGSTDPLLLT